VDGGVVKRRQAYVRVWSGLTGLAVRVAHVRHIDVLLRAVLLAAVVVSWGLNAPAVAMVGLVVLGAAVVGGELHMLVCRACCPDEAPDGGTR
jgi:hypothetical protein